MKQVKPLRFDMKSDEGYPGPCVFRRVEPDLNLADAEGSLNTLKITRLAGVDAGLT
jgi:hypothetical protein